LPTQSNILSTQEKPQPEYLSVKDVAALLAIGEPTTRALLRRGNLPGVRLGDGPWRVRRAELEEMFRAEK
jgi:excisionase family DNA binding protein